MFLEHNSGRLRSLVERTAVALAALPATERGEALQLLDDVVYARAVEHRGVGFAVNFSALFLDAVRARLEGATTTSAAADGQAVMAAFDLPPPASAEPAVSLGLE